MIRKITRHMATSLVRMPERKWERWGKKTLCGRKFYRGDERLTCSTKWLNCVQCLEVVVAKKGKELEYLSWALNDLKISGKRRLRSPFTGEISFHDVDMSQ